MGQGREAAKTFLSENPEIAERIAKGVIEVVNPVPVEAKELEEAKAE